MYRFFFVGNVVLILMANCWVCSICRFVLNTDTSAQSVKEFLQQYYAKVWVEYVVRNPLWAPGTPVASELFKQKSDQFIRQSLFFGSKSI